MLVASASAGHSFDSLDQSEAFCLDTLVHTVMYWAESLASTACLAAQDLAGGLIAGTAVQISVVEEQGFEGLFGIHEVARTYPVLGCIQQ